MRATGSSTAGKSQPPKRSLAPGESVTVNEAVTDVPRSARFAEIGWKPGLRLRYWNSTRIVSAAAA